MSRACDLVKVSASIRELLARFPDDATAEEWFVAWRWPNGITCPHCDSDNVAKVTSRKPMPFRCRKCRQHFSVKSQTVMQSSKLGVQTWLLAMFLILSRPKGDQLNPARF